MHHGASHTQLCAQLGMPYRVRAAAGKEVHLTASQNGPSCRCTLGLDLSQRSCEALLALCCAHLAFCNVDAAAVGCKECMLQDRGRAARVGALVAPAVLNARKHVCMNTKTQALQQVCNRMAVAACPAEGPPGCSLPHSSAAATVFYGLVHASDFVFPRICFPYGAMEPPTLPYFVFCQMPEPHVLLVEGTGSVYNSQ